MRLISLMRSRLRRPAHATVVAYLAAFLALSTGGAWAAARIGASNIKRNAVHSRHIANGAVGPRDLRRGAVTSSRLAHNAVTASKIAADAVSGPKVLDGSLGTGDLADGSVSSGKLADGSVTTTKIAPDAVTGAKVADDSLTGSDVNESTLGQVPDAAELGGKPPSAYLTSSVYKKESPVGPGTRLGDNTNVIGESCDPGDQLLAGGPANISATSKLLESFPSPGSTNSWSARINDDGTADNFSVVVLCLNQTP